MKRLVGCAVAGFVVLAALGCGTTTRECKSDEQCEAGEICDVTTRLCVQSSLSLTGGALPEAMKDVAYEHALTAAGGVPPYVWALKTVPAELMWLTIGADTGLLAGIPAAASPAASFEVEVTDSMGVSALATFDLAVRTCEEGISQACYVAVSGACLVGQRTCTEGEFTTCSLDGVESTSTDACGANCVPCDLSVADSCVGGSCACGTSSACSGAGAACCSGSCVSTTNDVENCGGCGAACDVGRANAGRQCVDGTCDYPCSDGWGRCGADANAPGCNTNLMNDVNNCGACGNACSLTAGAAGVACVLGKCEITSCVAGREDCDKKHNTGCEIDITDDVNNCGACAKGCDAVANGVPACQAGQCKATCNAGFSDCDDIFGTGCEINTTTDASNCGACNAACSLTPNSTAVACSASQCQVATCVAGFGNCNGTYNDGCETDLTSSVQHCGACNNACTPHSTVSSTACVASTCSIAQCKFPKGDCNNIYGDGCEASLTTASNCGACNNQCASGEFCTLIGSTYDCL